METQCSTGKRFFTYSKVEVKGRIVTVRLYELVGVFSILDLLDQVLELAFNPESIHKLATASSVFYSIVEYTLSIK
ncbi:MAG: hypothetical protein QXP29_06555 [Candidatus Nezhaarchaeales archaeon]